MKKLIWAALAAAVLLACKKQAPVGVVGNPYLQAVIAQLRDSLSSADFSRLDTGVAYLTDPGLSGRYCLRIGLRGKPVAGDFLLVRTDRDGRIQAGGLVHLENTTPAYSYRFSGAVQVRSFGGRVTMESDIVDGRIVQLHSGRRPVVEGSGTKEVTVLPAPDADWLPEVVVVGYSGGSSTSSYMSLDALLGPSSGDLGINAGSSPSDGGGGSGGSGTGGGSSSSSSNGSPSTPSSPYTPIEPPGTFTHGSGLNLVVTKPLDLEQEYVYNLPIIDIKNFFHCFDLIPSEGATYTIQLCADVPSNNNPDASMVFSGGIFAGHTFLVVSKSVGGSSVTQVFGYYPGSPLSAWNPFLSVSSVIRNNAGAEVNASITMTINSDQFNTLRSTAISLSARPYSLDKSNCSDFALGVFNSVRQNPLTVQPYILKQAGIVMGNGLSSEPITVPITNSPQMIYEKLSAMKSNGDPEASNIQLNLSHDLHAPDSHGECK